MSSVLVEVSKIFLGARFIPHGRYGGDLSRDRQSLLWLLALGGLPTKWGEELHALCRCAQSACSHPGNLKAFGERLCRSRHELPLSGWIVAALTIKQVWLGWDMCVFVDGVSGQIRHRVGFTIRILFGKSGDNTSFFFMSTSGT